MKTTILFDLDGTLIDSTEAILESFYHSFDSLGVQPPKKEDIESKIGYTLEDIFAFLGVEKSTIDEHVLAYKAHYGEVSKPKTYLLDGAKEAIELASTFARLGIVTTKTSRYSRELLEHMGVMGYFECLIGREDVENVKPHPEPIYKALAQLGKNGAEEKNDIWMIGDTFLDIEAAKNAGIRHIALMTGYGDKNHLESLSDILTQDALEAVKLIKELNKK
jgi:phosphoglycolate phosphatase